ncbi:hypothetical protein [Actinosynnema sp. NPDC023587]|uniref:hypothetical protein n=1 Tax=Actinosynnema sp. NPDC023587 TaxID=3154695 RepID=UPI0033DD83EC
MSPARRKPDGPPPIVHPGPTPAVVKQLYGTAWRCGFAGCLQPLYRVTETGQQVLNSTIAHIHARSEGGPRWKKGMSAEDNRAPENLMPMCLEHSKEIDDLWQNFPADLLREWKEQQLQECRDLDQSWHLNSRQVQEVMDALDHRRIGTQTAGSSAVLAAARIVGQLVVVAGQQRAVVARAVGAWQALRDHVNRSMPPAWDATTGQLLRVEPSLMETRPHQVAVSEALAAAIAATQSPTTTLIGELRAIEAADPDLVPWCAWVQAAAAVVVAASGRWPGSSSHPVHPLADNGDLSDALAELERAFTALSARWNGQAAEDPPPPPPPVEAEPESEAQRAAREHEELLDSARPWARVTGLAYDPDLYQRLLAATEHAVMFPVLPSLMAIDLFATTRLAASVARNADPDTYRSLITQAAELQPLVVAVALVRSLMFTAEEAERLELHDHARTTLVALMDVEQWREVAPWQDNEYHSRSLLDWTSSIHGEETVRDALAAGLTDTADLLGPLLIGIATWKEQRDSHTWALRDYVRGIRDLPPWLPVDTVVTEIHRQFPDLTPTQHDNVGEDIKDLRDLAADLLRAATSIGSIS